MKSKRCLPAILLAALVLLIGGCVPSLNPFYTEKDIVITQPNLAGTWSDAESIWTFERNADAKSYALTIKDKAESTFTARLLKLENNFYLDLAPKNYKTEGKEFYSVHLIPAHTLVRARIEGERLMLTAMDIEKVSKMLKADPKLVAHQFIEHEVSEDKIPLLLASTAELQAFVTGHREEIFGEGETTLTRQKPASKP